MTLYSNDNEAQTNVGGGGAGADAYAMSARGRSDSAAQGRNGAEALKTFQSIRLAQNGLVRGVGAEGTRESAAEVTFTM